MIAAVSAQAGDPSRRRALLVGVLVAYAAGLALVLLQPVPEIAGRVVWHLNDVLVHRLGVPLRFAGAGRVEFALNVLAVVPAGLVLRLLVPRHPWANWVVYGFVGACLVELVQGVGLPARSAQFVDVVANTGGMLAGVLLGSLVLLAERGARPAGGTGH